MVVHVIPLILPSISVRALSGSIFSLTFPGQSGVGYIVEQATNLGAKNFWQGVATISGTGMLQVVDANATNAMRFYRVRIP